jgi:hypothetical protein
MELMKKQLEEIGERVSSGSDLRDILVTQFPEAEISILRRYNNDSGEASTEDVFFERVVATDYVRKEILSKVTEDLSETHPFLKNSTLLRITENLPESYHILGSSIRRLEEGKVRDRKTKQLLEDLDKADIYFFLEDQLQN